MSSTVSRTVLSSLFSRGEQSGVSPQMTSAITSLAAKFQSYGTTSSSSSSSSTPTNAPRGKSRETTPLNSRVPEAEETPSSPLDQMRQQGQRIYRTTVRGFPSFRIFSFFGGIGMTITSVMDLHSAVIARNPGKGMVAIYTFLFGVVISILEGRKYSCPTQYEMGIRRYFRLFDHTWGRGVLSVFAGSLQCSQLTSWFSIVSGAIMMFLGILGMVASWGATEALTRLRESIQSRSVLRAVFQEYDQDNDGLLGMQDFSKLCDGVAGISFHHFQLVAAFGAIVEDDDGAMDFDEFSKWWSTWNVEEHRDSGRSLDLLV